MSATLLPGEDRYMPQNHIRLATPDDQSAIETIVEAAYSGYVVRMGMKPLPMLDDYAAHIASGQAHVLEDLGKIQGILILIPEESEMMLDNVAVMPSAKGRGYGRALLQFAESTAKAYRFKSIRLYTSVTMVENIALYQHIGYEETHRLDENGRKRVFMRKSLI